MASSELPADVLLKCSTIESLPVTELTTIRELADRYETLLFDAYGVLVNEATGLPGARELINWLEATDKNYFIVTNDASRSVASRSEKFTLQGVPVRPERIVNSGSLIPTFFGENSLIGAPAVVFGGSDATDYVQEAGAKLLPLNRMRDAAVFVLADDSGYDWRESVNELITVLNQKILDKEPFHLLLPNPDLIYSSGERAYSFAVGALAEVIETALTRLFGESPDYRFARLGKPYAPIFEEAMRRAGTPDRTSVVMIGDQFETDIAGAVSFGISSAVVTTGINRLNTLDSLSALPPEHRPDYLLTSLSLD